MLQKGISFIPNKLIVTLGFIACINGLFSQTILLNPSEKYIGVSLGVNNSMVFFNPSVDQNMIFLGTSSGISYRYITEKHVGLQMELKYSQRGWNEASGKYTRQINYIEFPFLTHIYLGNKNRFIFNIGTKISYLLNESFNRFIII